MRRRAAAVGILLLLLAAQLVLIRRFRAEVPEAVELWGQQEPEITLAQAQTAQDAAAAWQRGLVRRNGEAENISAWCVAATSAYGDMCRLTFPAGGWFAREAYGIEENYAVLSEELAHTLFGADTAPGATLQVDGAEYTVYGIYDRPESIGYRIAEGGTPILYVNRLPQSDLDSTYVNQLLLNAQNSHNGVAIAAKAEEKYGSKLTGERFYITNAILFAGEIVRYTMLGCYLVPLLAGLRRGGHWLLCLYSKRSQGDLEWKEASVILLKAAGWCGAALAGFWLLCRGMAFPAEWLPEGSFLNWGHYSSLLLRFYQNLMAADIPSKYATLAGIYLPIIAGIGITMVLITWLMPWRKRNK